MRVASPTLKTNISLLRMARVLNPPSQMLGLALGWDGLSPGGSLGGRVCLSGLRGSEGGWERGGGTVGKGLVGWGSLSGGPENRRWIMMARVGLGLSYLYTRPKDWNHRMYRQQVKGKRRGLKRLNLCAVRRVSGLISVI